MNEIEAKSIFGNTLTGDKAVRFVFVDEAGTSLTDDHIVVVALTVNADSQLGMAERLFREMALAVPGPVRGNGDFVFHATDIWHDHSLRDKWAMADRNAYLKAVMSIPRRLGIPISVAVTQRNFYSQYYNADDIQSMGDGWTLDKIEHAITFAYCITRADKFIRDRCHPNEVATLVAENVDGMRGRLKRTLRMTKSNFRTLPPDGLKKNQRERSLGYFTQESQVYATRIREPMHFVEKGDEILVQIADACAYGIRRYFCEKDTFGDQWIKAIIGQTLNREDWSEPSSSTFCIPSERL